MFYLKILSGIVIISLFVFLVLYSLNRDLSRFLKYLSAYLAFFLVVGLMFYLVPEHSLFIALLAGSGWVFLIVKGARAPKEKASKPDDID